MIRILSGDSRETLQTLESDSVHCCVTSPPYWGLRDYGHSGQIGQEDTPEAFEQAMVTVFREVRRVLKSDGTCWLNLGDSYAADRGGTYMPAETPDGGVSGQGDGESMRGRGSKEDGSARRNCKKYGLKHKDLVGIPWMVAFALRADGWFLRQDIIWHKPNPMPESVTDRCTKAHEYIFLLSKSARYYYDADAVKEPVSKTGCGNRKEFRGGGSYTNNNSFDNDAKIPNRTTGNTGRGGRNAFRGQGHFRETAGGPANREGRDMQDVGAGDTRNKRSVWTVATKPYKGAHFATFPTELITPCILAGCPVGGTVLDPFGGSGTTGEVALSLGRKAVICELNPEYIKLIEARTSTTQGLAL